MGQFRFNVPVIPLKVLFIVLLSALLSILQLFYVPMRMSTARLFEISAKTNGGPRLGRVSKPVNRRFLRRPMYMSGPLVVQVKFPVKVMFIMRVFIRFGFRAMFMVVSLSGVTVLFLRLSDVVVLLSVVLMISITILMRPCEVTLGIMLLKWVRKLTRADIRPVSTPLLVLTTVMVALL